jgi:hypothetical protein
MHGCPELYVVQAVREFNIFGRRFTLLDVYSNRINADFQDREYKKQTRRRRFLYYLNFIGV